MKTYEQLEEENTLLKEANRQLLLAIQKLESNVVCDSEVKQDLLG
jgi:hypothetical protein